jgi:hypothetical protein
LWLGSAWFFFNMSLEPRDRIRGDAAQYLSIAHGAGSVWEVMTSIDERPPGFPLVVYLLKNLARSLGFENPLHVLNFIAVALYFFHLASSFVSFMVSRKLARDCGIELPLVLLCVLLLHPGLISYTTVLLTDTFASDLLMVAISLLIATRWVPLRSQIALALLGGGVLAFSVLVRIAYGVPSVAALGLFAVVSAWRIWRSPTTGPKHLLELESGNAWNRALRTALLALLGFGLGFAPAALKCRATYGGLCLQNPNPVDTALTWSIATGWESPRLYWSRFAPAPELMNVVVDPLLSARWAAPCPIQAEHRLESMIRCYVRKPHIGAVFLFKKSLAVFDSYHLQPYAVAITPRWARRYSRFFGALAYAGFVGASILLVAGVRRPKGPPELVLLTAPPVVIALFQSQLHVEGRFGFGALFGCYFALAWLWATRGRGDRGRRTVVYVALGLAAAVFLVQTSAWDALDPCLRRIEGWE